MEKHKGDKIVSASSCVSGSLSFLGGYQVCHNVCLGIIAVLSVVGITVVGMPLLFLQRVALPFWILAVALLGVTLVFYFQRKCISKNLIIFNSGIIIAGVPFKAVQDYAIILWIIGGSMVLLSILLFIKNRMHG